MSNGYVATEEQIAWFESIDWVYTRNRYAYHTFHKHKTFRGISIVGAKEGWLVRKDNPVEALPLKFNCPIEAYQWAVLEGLIYN